MFQFLDLHRQVGGIAGVAVEDLDRDRAVVGRAEQAIDDLEITPFAVAAVAVPGQRAASPIHVAGRNVVQHEGAVLEMAFGQDGLNGGLACTQPPNVGGRSVGEVAQDALTDLAVLAIILPQQDGRGEFRLGTDSIFMDEKNRFGAMVQNN